MSMRDTANAATKSFKDVLKQDLSYDNVPSMAMEHNNIVTPNCNTCYSKLTYIGNLILKVKKEIISAPVATSANEKDTIEDKYSKDKQ